MNARRIWAKLVKFYRIFVAPPKLWRLPKKCEVLIYDACGAETFARYLTRYRVEVIPSRGNLVSMPCLFRAAMTLDFWIGGNPIQAYSDAYIRMASPKIVLTFIDNDPDFFTLSQRFIGVRTMFLQNGTRDDWLARISPASNLRVDFMLMHGTSVCRYYKKKVAGEAIAVGSIKNNEVAKSTDRGDNSILFISQFHPMPPGKSPLYVNPDGQMVFWSQFYAADIQVVTFLADWCRANDRMLKVCARTSEKHGAEFDFFEEHLKNCNWEFVPASDNHGSYRLVDEAELVISIDSTLGYESLGRGGKTACFSCRGEFLGGDCRKFGWPAVLPENGPFWTNQASESEYQRVMEFLSKVSDYEWERVRKEYANELMEYDYGNTRFARLLEQLLPTSNEKVENHA